MYHKITWSHKIWISIFDMIQISFIFQKQTMGSKSRLMYNRSSLEVQLADDQKDSDLIRFPYIQAVVRFTSNLHLLSGSKIHGGDTHYTWDGQFEYDRDVCCGKPTVIRRLPTDLPKDNLERKTKFII